MIILLDTQILVWLFLEPNRISETVRAKLADNDLTVLFSPISIWEIGIKSALPRSNLNVDPTEILWKAREVDFEELAVSSQAAILAARLPLHHRDPFDRMLVAQAMNEPARLLTTDAKLARYSELVDVI